jgi:hypothetical protein
LCSISHFSVSLDITHGGIQNGTQFYSGTALTPTWLTPTLRAVRNQQRIFDVSELLLRGNFHAAI